MAKLQESHGQYHLNLPPAVVKLQKWKKGEEFGFVPFKNGDILITKIGTYVWGYKIKKKKKKWKIKKSGVRARTPQNRGGGAGECDQLS